MTREDMITEAERLEAEAARLIEDANAEALASGRLARGFSLLHCVVDLPLKERARTLRAEAACMPENKPNHADRVDLDTPSVIPAFPPTIAAFSPSATLLRHSRFNLR